MRTRRRCSVRCCDGKGGRWTWLAGAAGGGSPHDARAKRRRRNSKSKKTLDRSIYRMNQCAGFVLLSFPKRDASPPSDVVEPEETAKQKSMMRRDGPGRFFQTYERRPRDRSPLRSPHRANECRLPTAQAPASANGSRGRLKVKMLRGRQEQKAATGPDFCWTVAKALKHQPSSG